MLQFPGKAKSAKSAKICEKKKKTANLAPFVPFSFKLSLLIALNVPFLIVVRKTNLTEKQGQESNKATT